MVQEVGWCQVNVYSNSMPDEVASKESGREHETPPSLWRELCSFGVYLVTVVLVFEGLTVVCRLVWPHQLRVALFASLLVLLGWMLLADWLKVFGVRRAVLSGRRYASEFQFLLYFVFFSAAMVLVDKWQGHSVDILGACLAGLIYALCMVSIPPKFPSHREDPFATKTSFHRSE